MAAFDKEDARKVNTRSIQLLLPSRGSPSSVLVDLPPPQAKKEARKKKNHHEEVPVGPKLSGKALKKLKAQQAEEGLGDD